MDWFACKSNRCQNGSCSRRGMDHLFADRHWRHASGTLLRQAPISRATLAFPPPPPTDSLERQIPSIRLEFSPQSIKTIRDNRREGKHP